MLFCCWPVLLVYCLAIRLQFVYHCQVSEGQWGGKGLGTFPPYVVCHHFLLLDKVTQKLYWQLKLIIKLLVEFHNIPLICAQLYHSPNGRFFQGLQGRHKVVTSKFWIEVPFFTRQAICCCYDCHLHSVELWFYCNQAALNSNNIFSK